MCVIMNNDISYGIISMQRAVLQSLSKLFRQIESAKLTDRPAIIILPLVRSLL